MEKVEFKVDINASKEKVWSVLWNDATYRKWTSVFSPTSHAVTDWMEGSKILFIDDSGAGMVSKVRVNDPYRYMSIEHLGEVKNNVEDTESDKVKAWAGSQENYTLVDNGNSIELIVELNVTAEFKEYLSKLFPQALEKVKQLSEE